MKEGTATVHASTVREFLHIIVAQAKAALAGIEKPGLLQLSRLHPTSETLVPSLFLLDDIEHMVKASIVDSEAGHQCLPRRSHGATGSARQRPRQTRRHNRSLCPDRRQ